MKVRPPAVAGIFYERDPHRLREQVRSCLPDVAEAKTPAIGAVVPHAGLMYSGPVAGALYGRCVLTPTVLILCPNHTGAGHPAAINGDGAWATPFGVVDIDRSLASDLMAAIPLLGEDSGAHAREHSLEVQLPFVQLLEPATRFVPICLALPTWELCRSVGEAIGGVIAARRATGENITIIASTDLNHYEDQETTLTKDQLAIDRILALDAEGLWATVRQQSISMCGIIPTTVMLVAAKALGATSAKLTRHATSGDVSGDYERVVGYASLSIQ